MVASSAVAAEICLPAGAQDCRQRMSSDQQRGREHEALSALCLPNPGKHHDAVSFHVAAESFAVVDRSFC